MQRLRELRHARGISQQDLADVLHVTQQSIYKYETDKAEPDLDIVIGIAKYFDVSVDYLVGYTDIPIKYEYYDIEKSITSQEDRVLKYYRALSKEGQDTIQRLIPRKI